MHKGKVLNQAKSGLAMEEKMLKEKSAHFELKRDQKKISGLCYSPELYFISHIF